MTKYVIVDIDGTIADISHRKKYVENVLKKDWVKFFEGVKDDKPIKNIIELVDILSLEYNIVFCTGRGEKLRYLTEQFIQRQFEYISISNCKILMRSENDRRKDIEVKPELLRKAGISKNEVAFILEDRDSVVKMWRKLGFTCLQVCDGNY